jgi:sugar lactone lactonase YvrE
VKRSSSGAVAAGAVAAALLGLLAPPAVAAPPPAPPTTQVVTRFDPAANETPEGLAVARDGTVYVSLALTREIRAVAPDGAQRRVAVLGDTGALGPLALDRNGDLYAALGSGDAATHGIWRVTPAGRADRVAALPVEGQGNGIAFDARGDLYVADSTLGVIHVLPRGSTTARIWAEGPALAPAPVLGFDFGVNGLQEFRGALYASNTGQGTILRIPIDRRTGRAGAPQVIARDLVADDLALDVRGRVYVTTDPFDTVVRVDRDGSQHVLLDAADGLDGPTAAKFGVRGADRSTLYVTNAAFPFFAAPGERRDPTLLRVPLDAPGYVPPPLR